MFNCLICGQICTTSVRLRRHMEGRIRKKLPHHPNYGGHELSPEETNNLLAKTRLLNSNIENGFKDIVERITIGDKNFVIIRIVAANKPEEKLLNLWESQNRISKYFFEIPATEENESLYIYEWILPESIPLYEAVKRGFVSGGADQSFA